MLDMHEKEKLSNSHCLLLWKIDRKNPQNISIKHLELFISSFNCGIIKFVDIGKQSLVIE